MNVPHTPPAGTNWTSKRAYATALACLLAGIAAGYLLRGAVPLPKQFASAAVAAPVATGENVAQVTPAQLKQMADSTAKPLLMQLNSEPNNPRLLVQLGYIYYKTRSFNQAAGYYKRSLDLKDDAVVRVELGRAYYYSGNPDAALAEFERVLRTEPKNSNALFNAGIIKWQEKLDSDGAIACWQKLLKTNPQHPRRADIERLIALAKQHRGALVSEKGAVVPQ